MGAHIGSHTVGLARAVGSRGRVLAFEPQRSLHDVLAANAALTGLHNVDAHLLAVGACPAADGFKFPTGPQAPSRRPLVPIPIVDVRSGAAQSVIPFWENVTGPHPNEGSPKSYAAVSIVDTQHVLRVAASLSGGGGGGQVPAGSGASEGSEGAGDPVSTQSPVPEEQGGGASAASWVDWVEQVCLDELPVLTTLPCPRLIKVDCEGMEAQVMGVMGPLTPAFGWATANAPLIGLATALFVLVLEA